jgi:hypothetical protein
MEFLEMGARVKTTTDISDQFAEGGPPVFEVEHEEGYEPFNEFIVIETLAEELLRTRAQLSEARAALQGEATEE